LCQHQAGEILKIKPQLDQLGVKLIAVGNGNKYFAKKFADGISFDGEVYLDPESKAFAAANLPRLSVWQAVKRFMMNWAALKFFREISPQYANSDLEGDGQQTGGVFVVGPGENSEVLFEFREFDNEVTQFADHDAILKACGQS